MGAATERLRRSDDASWKPEIAAVEAQIAFAKGDFSRAMQLMRDAGDTAFAAQYNIALTAYRAKQFPQALDMAERLSRKAIPVGYCAGGPETG